MASVEAHQKANAMRRDIIEMISCAGSGHPGGSLSCTDILSALYFGGVMTYDPPDPTLDSRDRFILCKGHAAPALYAVLAEAGFFPKEELKTLRKLGTRLQGHPDSTLLPGVEVSTGSLGQGLSIAAGLAAGLRLKDNPAKVYALLGDGECQEGQVWEAANFAAAQNLGNLVAIVDANGLQIDGALEDVCSAGSLSDKFAAFGWEVHEADGHDIDGLIPLFTSLENAPFGRPQGIIAKTVKGKGVSFMENQAGWHGKAPDEEQTRQALAALESEASHD